MVKPRAVVLLARSVCACACARRAHLCESASVRVVTVAFARIAQAYARRVRAPKKQLPLLMLRLLIALCTSAEVACRARLFEACGHTRQEYSLRALQGRDCEHA